jgi:predicted nuclease of predicted toxin-antitoxin system
MIRFLIDEDMPRSTAKLLRQAGFECLDVRDTELRGGKDDAIYQRAQKEDWFIISGDLGFPNSLRYPLGSHKGIVIARVPNEIPTDKLNQILIETITNIREDIPGNLTIIEPEKVRIRRR